MNVVVINKLEPGAEKEAAQILRFFVASACPYCVAFSATGSFDDWRFGQVRDAQSAFEMTKPALVRGGRVMAPSVDERITRVPPRTIGVSSRAGELSFVDDILVFERRDGEIWSASYRTDALWLVMVSTDRRSFSVSTGHCDCLFNKRLRVWLVPTDKVALYHVGTDRMDVLDGESEEKCP